jgi:VIT1/CCC1 family predicted Fe2+/Mn2+ transporter
MSMAAGEYVSVSSQADTERADRRREASELSEQPERELAELRNIYIRRGLTPELARTVAEQMTEHGALEAHLRDELGITESVVARPLQAALISALTFAVGAALPLGVAAAAPLSAVVPTVAIASLVCLAGLGGASARTGGAPVLRATVRVCFWGALAMALTALIGRIFGAVL